MFNLLSFFLLPLIISFAATPLVIKFAYKIGIVDDPKKNKHPKVIHTYPVPRGGGLGIFIAIFIATLIFLPLDKHVLAILSGAIVVVIIGLLDDKFNLNPYFRVIAGLLAASIPIMAGVGISFITNPGGGIVDLSIFNVELHFLGGGAKMFSASSLLALFYIFFMMNFLNMGAKGVDGQLPGVASIASMIIALLSLKFSADIAEWPIIILALVTSGSFAGFIPWNFYPQKIMPSYSGSTLAGYMLAVLSILSTTKVGTLIVTLGIPIIDTLYVVIRRVLKGKSPVWGDKNHLHHKLLDAGLSKRQVALLYWSFTGLLGIIALNLNTAFKIYTILGIVTLLGGIITWLTYKPQSR
jgi:UDP-GlcNAc:undecaprenyl-phosphate/decaprenyl-phosphate GlcNAc-1-phosphate transferase